MSNAVLERAAQTAAEHYFCSSQLGATISPEWPVQFCGCDFQCTHTRHIRPTVMRWAVQVGCVLSLDVPLASGAVPPGFNPLRRGWVYRPAPKAPLLRGIPTGSGAFLEMPGACELRTCAWTHPKKALCHTRPVGGTEDKYYRFVTRLSPQDEVIG